MTRQGEKIYRLDLSQIGVNLSASPHGGLKGAEAVISRNFDYGDLSGALVGRRGTTTIAGAQALGGAGLNGYRAYNGISGKYTLVAFRQGGATKIGAFKAGDTAFHTLQSSLGGDFNLTDNARVSFTTDYDPALAKIVVSGTNGIDNPFYWDFTEWGNVTSYTFGTIAIKLKRFMPTPYGFQGRGRRWAYLRNTELVTIHASDPDDHRKFVDQGESIFFEVPQEDYSNPVVAMLPFKNQIVVFNLNSISSVYYTNNPDRFYDYNVQTYDNGTLNANTVTYWNGNVIFLDRREPYLFAWNGTRVFPLDPDRKITKGLQQWLDLTQLDEITMDVHKDTLLVGFKSRTHDNGGDGAQWVCAINLSRMNERGIQNYPASFWDIPARHIFVTDSNTDFGQVWYVDSTANYVRRLYDWYDGTSNVFGDNNNQTGGTVANVTYQLRTGWLQVSDFFKMTEFWMNADYEGAPAATDTLKIRYRMNGWTSWRDILIGQVRKIDWVPVSATAYGREIQFELLWVTKTARPMLFDMQFKYVKMPRLRRIS